MTTWLFIESSDVWLFRDGKPFDAGAEHRARSLFPPNPTTIQGALRSKLLFDSGVDLRAFARKEASAQQAKDWIGWPGEPPPFALRGPFIARRTGERSVEPLFPMPADVVQDREAKTYHLLKPLRDGGPFTANWPSQMPKLRPLWIRSSRPLESATGWVNKAALVRCLNGTAAPHRNDVLREYHLFAREDRFGVAIDSAHKSYREGFLYQVQFVRPRAGVGLLVAGDENLHWPEAAGALALGGERRVGHFEKVEPPDEPPARMPQPKRSKTRFKVYFATPARFDNGWRAVDWSTWFDGKNLTLVSAAVNRFYPAGGIRVDTESQKGDHQKVMHRYVPAGSIFFFECDGPAQRKKENGVLRPVTDDNCDGQIGFGQIYTGRWDYV
jgi:CRISPR-associated protein Cmr3